MRKQRLWGYLGVALVVAFAIGLGVGASRVMAQTSSSNNYQVVETEFGTGDLSESCSGQYCATTTMGELGGSSSATSAEIGKAKYTEPILEMMVEAGSSNLGVLTTEHTATATIAIKIRNYLTGGYILQIIGDPPKFEGHTLATPKQPTASAPGTEQFGMNVVKNTVPAVGADPVQDPVDEGIFGEPGESYATADMFMYQSGDVFARSVENSGGTDYTVTMIVNIASSTPSGRYSADFAAVLIPAF